MMGEAQSICERFSILLDQAKRIDDRTRLDVADDAERLSKDARVFFQNAPIGRVHPLIQSIGERCEHIANAARARQ